MHASAPTNTSKSLSVTTISATAALLFVHGLRTTELLGVGLGQSCCARLRWLLNGDSIFDFAGHQREGLLYVLAVFGGGLEEPHAVVIGEFLSFLEANLALRL